MAKAQITSPSARASAPVGAPGGSSLAITVDSPVGVPPRQEEDHLQTPRRCVPVHHCWGGPEDPQMKKRMSH